jgi:hypothetical protein
MRYRPEVEVLIYTGEQLFRHHFSDRRRAMPVNLHYRAVRRTGSRAMSKRDVSFFG